MHGVSAGGDRANAESKGFGLYIGPWQEFKLARFREQALKQFRHEWKVQLASQLRGSAKGGELPMHSEAVDALIASMPGASNVVSLRELRLFLCLGYSTKTRQRGVKITN